MSFVWLVIAVLCVGAGLVLLGLDRRRRAGPLPSSPDPSSPDPSPPEPSSSGARVPEPRAPEPDGAGDLFTPEALPRLPGNG